MNPTPSKSLLRHVGRAIADYDMIRNGDRILLGLSGGKDSLTLLHILLHLQRYSPVHYELGVITVDPQVEGFDLSPLRPYLASLSIPYYYEAQPIMDRAREHMRKDSFCSWCARMKRGVMYHVARREHYSVLALAQHLDDLAESFLMSAFHAGQLRTMKAHYRIDAGDLRVIRPLVYVRERQTRDFARQAGLPVIGDNCPACFRMPTRREHMKQLLAREEVDNKYLFKSLLSAMSPLLTENMPD
jgi:tRNA 2-thiocytidine biosynthesis protein TtcA